MTRYLTSEPQDDRHGARNRASATDRRAGSRFPRFRRAAIVGLGATFALDASSASAALFMEPVFNRVDDLEPGEVAVGLFAPDFLNPLTGEPFAVSDRPGRISTYPAGFPADQVNIDTLRFVNNTAFDITAMTLSIVGTAVEPEPFAFTVLRDPDVEAYFGDVDGDGRAGVSDIFGSIEVSGDGRTIRFGDGLIPAGGLFTDFNLASTTDGAPFLAAIDASFEGTPSPVPLPAAWSLLALPLGGMALWRRIRRSRGRAATSLSRLSGPIRLLAGNSEDRA